VSNSPSKGTALITGASRDIGAVYPYLLLELILPGESLIALLLWLYNHRPARA